MPVFFKDLIKPFYFHIKLQMFNFKWRKKNKHNNTQAKSIYPLKCVQVGNYTYGDLFVRYYRTSSEKLIVGNFCSLGPNITFYLGGEHIYTNVTTFPIMNNILHDRWECISKGPIIVGDDVWIGGGCTILSGVTIGQGAIIGAGSVVSKNIPPYAIYCGNKIVKYRFTANVCKKMERFNYSKLTFKDVQENAEIFYDVEKFLESDLFNTYKLS